MTPPVNNSSKTELQQPLTGSLPRQTTMLYIDLSVFWFSLSALWSGLITLVMQNLVKQMAGDQKDLVLGWALGVGALISTVICMFVGTMSDRSRWAMGRRRPYIIVGTVLSLPALMWLAYVKSIPMLMIDFCLIQLWTNVATSPYQAMVPDMVPKDRQGLASAYIGASSLVGQLVGFVVYGMYLSRLPVAMGIISAITALGMAYTVWRLPEKSAKDNPLPRIGIVETLIESFKANPREYPDFMRLIASRFMINMGFYTATEFLSYYVSDTLHAPNPDKLAAIIMLIATVSGLVGNFPAGILSDKTSKKTVVYVSNAVTAAAVLCFLLTSSVNVALAATFVFGAGLGAFMAVDWAFATNLLPDRDEAKYMGIWHVAFTVPQIVAPVIGGLVAFYCNHRFGPGLGYRMVMFIVLIYFGIGTVMIRPIREKRA